MLSKLAALVLLTFPLISIAGQWEICDYTVQIESSAPSGVRATVKEVAPKNPDFCETVGAALNFAPESEDYQSMLPKKRWPMVGTAATLRYRQLVGFCKNDGNWAAAGFKDTLLRWSMKQELANGNEKAIQPGVQG